MARLTGLREGMSSRSSLGSVLGPESAQRAGGVQRAKERRAAGERGSAGGGWWHVSTNGCARLADRAARVVGVNQ
jgi:hypothetical protein